MSLVNKLPKNRLEDNHQAAAPAAASTKKMAAPKSRLGLRGCYLRFLVDLAAVPAPSSSSFV
jgi:hypothetical protein